MSIYIACPRNCYTGGPTLLHQFCAELVKYGVDAKMAYYEGSGSEPGPLVHPRYEKYGCGYTNLSNVSDTNTNWIVFPETGIFNISRFKQARKAVWWLSVDNYVFGNLTFFQKIKKKATGDSRVERYLRLSSIRKRKEFRDGSLVHFVQSEYARLFLLSLGVDAEKIFDLSDYVDEAYLSTDALLSSERDDIVLYNPKKKGRVVSDLIEKYCDINVIPLQGMTEQELVAVMMRSKIYVDFGGHPGKDRLPREAALCGCIVITGKRGSAGNGIDVPIPLKYKLDDSVSAECLKNLIETIFVEYKDARMDFAEYRRKIASEKECFSRDVKAICSNVLIGDKSYG